MITRGKFRQRNEPSPATRLRRKPIGSQSARMDAFCRRNGHTEPQVPVDRLRLHRLTAGSGTTAGKSFSAELSVDQLAS